MPTGFDALGERDPDSPESDYAEMLAAMATIQRHWLNWVLSWRIGRLSLNGISKPQRPIWRWKILNDPERSLQWLQSLSRALMKPR